MARLFGIDGFQAEDLLGLPGHARMRAFAGIDAIPAAARRLAVVGS